MNDLIGFLGTARVIACVYLGIVFVSAAGLALFDRGAKRTKHAGEVTPERKAA
jgi:hypothetical protein